MKQLELFSTTSYNTTTVTSKLIQMVNNKNNRIDKILLKADKLEKANKNREALIEINKLRSEDLTVDEMNTLSEVELQLADKHNVVKRLGDD